MCCCLWCLEVIMKWILWMVRPPVEPEKRNINWSRLFKEQNLTQAALYSHEKLHKADVFVQPFNCLHISVREREIKYLESWQISLIIFHASGFQKALFATYIPKIINKPQSFPLCEQGWSSLGWPPRLSVHWTADTPEPWSCCTFWQSIPAGHLPALGGILGLPFIETVIF